MSGSKVDTFYTGQMTEKPWGSEELLYFGKHYLVKRLKMNRGHRCSLQYHEVKTESVFILSGLLKVTLQKNPPVGLVEEQLMYPGSVLTLLPGEVHRMEALEDSIYLEASTPENHDVVRLQDDYLRHLES